MKIVRRLRGHGMSDGVVVDLPAEKIQGSSRPETVLGGNTMYWPDTPLHDQKADRFDRWPFAERIARTTADRETPSSLVIGIYGKWGEGKTTVLNYIRSTLADSDQIVLVPYNPWRYGDEAHLLSSFFTTLAAALGKRLSSSKEVTGDVLEMLSILFGIFSLGPGPVQISPGSSVKGIADKLKKVDLDQLKTRISQLLKAEGKQVIVLIDDIDRLDKTEVQAIFRLIKLTVDFEYTTYVLAFDDEMVAEALSERYGSGDKAAGRNFLEKIVQVPLRLPKASTIALREVCFERIKAALAASGANLPEEQEQIFLDAFIECFETRLHTPRMSVHYANALMFALPLLRGEVNLVDLLLVEGMRVFYPELYIVVRNSRDAFLGGDFRLNSSLLDQAQQALERIRALVEEGIRGTDADDQIAAKALLRRLFPWTSRALQDPLGEPIREQRWAEEQRVCSPDYFDRYFSYAVLRGDISDVLIDTFLSELHSRGVAEIASRMVELGSERRMGVFLSKLKRRARGLPEQDSWMLALAIAKLGGSLSASQREVLYDNTVGLAGSVMADLLGNVQQGSTRLGATRAVIAECQPVAVALRCLYSLRTTEDRGEPGRAILPAEKESLGADIAQRIAELAKTQYRFINSTSDAPHLLRAWAIHGSRDATNNYCQRVFEDSPDEAVGLILGFFPTSLSYSRIRRLGDLHREQYNMIVQIVDADVVLAALRRIYGDALDVPVYDSVGERPIAERAAHQFAYIYHAATDSDTSDKVVVS